MSRRRPANDQGVSLFPFMSILACLIGILTLMISVIMQVSQMQQEGRTEEELARAMENRDLIKQAEKMVEEITELQEKFEEDNASLAALKKIEDRKIALTLKIENLKKATDPEKTDVELQKLIENMKKEIVALKNERPPLQKRLKELQAELKARKEAPKPAESVVIKPRGVGSRAARNIFFVECNSTGIVIMNEDGQPGKRISTEAIRTSGDYNAHLDKVKKTRDSMILFLMRKGGLKSYQWAAGQAEVKYKINTGKLPVPNNGKIDLSLFK